MLQLATHSDSLLKNWIEIIMTWMEHRLVTLLSINLGTSVLSASKGAASKDIYCNFQISIETGARKLLHEMNLMTCSIPCHNMIHELQIYLPCCHVPIIPFYHITSYGASLCPGLGKFIKNKWPSLFITPLQVTCTKYGWSHQSDRNMILRDKNVIKHVMDLWHVECTYVFVSFSSAPRLKVAENCLSDPVFRVRRTLRATFGSILSQFSTHPLSLWISNDIQIWIWYDRPRSSSHSAKSRWQDLKPPT